MRITIAALLALGCCAQESAQAAPLPQEANLDGYEAQESALKQKDFALDGTTADSMLLGENWKSEAIVKPSTIAEGMTDAVEQDEATVNEDQEDDEEFADEDENENEEEEEDDEEDALTASATDVNFGLASEPDMEQDGQDVEADTMEPATQPSLNVENYVDEFSDHNAGSEEDDGSAEEMVAEQEEPQSSVELEEDVEAGTQNDLLAAADSVADNLDDDDYDPEIDANNGRNPYEDELYPSN
jgi:hypothetical protein